MIIKEMLEQPVCHQLVNAVQASFDLRREPPHRVVEEKAHDSYATKLGSLLSRILQNSGDDQTEDPEFE